MLLATIPQLPKLTLRQYPMEEPKKSKKALIIGIVFLLLFATAYALVLCAFKNEGENRAAALSPNEKLGNDRIDASARIVTADPVKGDISVRLTFTPHGSLLSADGVTLSRDLLLDVASATGKHAYEFKKGKRMDPVEAIVEIFDGEPMEYPFDKHEAQLSFYFEPAGAAATDADKSIPVAVQLYGSVSGLKIVADYAKEHADDHVVIDLSLSRAPTAIFFSVFIMVAMWSLTLGVVCLVFRVLAGHRKIEIGMFSFLGALLFAFPALRNSQPGTPPIGTYSDFLAFFWAEVLIALSLLSVVLTWLIRGPGGDKQK
jgi:hypothetical protein